MGVGKYTGREGKWTCTYIVARYKVAGNVRGQFKENVDKGTFRLNYCNSVGDNAVDEPELLDIDDLAKN